MRIKSPSVSASWCKVEGLGSLQLRFFSFLTQFSLLLCLELDSGHTASIDVQLVVGSCTMILSIFVEIVQDFLRP